MDNPNNMEDKMSVKFKNAQELSAYFDELNETIHDEEYRMELRGEAIAANIFVFSEYRRMKAKMKITNCQE